MDSEDPHSYQAMKAYRRPLRVQFEKLEKELNAELEGTKVDIDRVNAKFKTFCDVARKIEQLDQQALNAAVRECGVEEQDAEIGEQSDYQFRADLLEEKVNQLRLKQQTTTTSTESVAGSSVLHEPMSYRGVKLPKVELMTFNGELMKWLPFWSQFQKIHEDSTLRKSDKFWYLLQSLEIGSEAREVAASYPQSEDNYDKVIEALRRRFGNEDLLLQVYIREILKLVMANVSSKDKIPIKSLHLQLESHLRNLKTLKLENADPASWLYPLVESSLPERELYNWQRHPHSSLDTSKEDPPRSRLDLLMAFLEGEVEIKQRVDISKSFVEHKKEEKDRSVRKQEPKKSVPTLHGFHVGERKKCVFCDKSNHDSKVCFKAKNMTLTDKRNILRKKGLCFLCFGTHMVRNCDKPHCLACGGAHHKLICPAGRDEKEPGPLSKQRKVADQPDKTELISTSFTSNYTSGVTLQTLSVILENQGRAKTVRAFLDSGSERSYILATTAKYLGLIPKDTEIVVQSLFGGHTTERKLQSKYDVGVISVDHHFSCIIEVRDQNVICNTISRIPNNKTLLSELKSNGIKLSDAGEGCPLVELLIGADFYGKLLTGRIKKLDCNLVGIETSLGWTLCGSMKADNSKNCLALQTVTAAVCDTVVSKLWDLELLGIRDPVEVLSETEKERELKSTFFAYLTRDHEGRYCVRLPWKIGRPPLPPNKDVALKRLESTGRKLIKTGYFTQYSTLLKEWEAEGFIEKVCPPCESVEVHYIPHRAVIKTSSLTTPVRPLYDASCKSGGNPSLNQCLEKGPNNIQMIFDVLLRFRKSRVGFVSDIRKAFQMIGVREEDRDVMRFLWYEDELMTNILEYRHARVMFGATCRPFILGAVLEYHLTNTTEDKEFGKELLETLYVDNCVTSENSLQDYHEFREKANLVLQEAKMDLRLWLSNIEDLEEPDTLTINVLGLKWDRMRDELFINIPHYVIPNLVTKRVVLSILNQHFDPISVTSPALLPMKVLIQRTWLAKKNWDEALSEEESVSFRIWCNEAQDFSRLRIPRLATGGIEDLSKWSLHVFADASKVAYSAVVFLRCEYEDLTSIQLLAAKSRLASIKPTTITRLELLGCFVAARLASQVKKVLGLDNIKQYYYSDSAVALAWIRRNDQWGTFVGNRTREINALLPPTLWKHVPGSSNPADLPSRGCSPRQLIKPRWWEGPAWLHKAEKEWPTSDENPNEQEVILELRKTQLPSAVVVSAVVRADTGDGLSMMFQNNQSFQSMIRVLG